MSNMEKIRQEIERRKKENMYDNLPITIGRYYEDRDLLAFIDSLPDEQLTWQDIKRIVNIADALLDDPKARIAIQNHSEEEYYQKVLDEYNKETSKGITQIKQKWIP